MVCQCVSQCVCVCVLRKKERRKRHTGWPLDYHHTRNILNKNPLSDKRRRRERKKKYGKPNINSILLCRNFHQSFCVLLFITSFLGPPFSDLFGIERDKEGLGERCLSYLGECLLLRPCFASSFFRSLSLIRFISYSWTITDTRWPAILSIFLSPLDGQENQRVSSAPVIPRLLLFCLVGDGWIEKDDVVVVVVAFRVFPSLSLSLPPVRRRRGDDDDGVL